ncbi:MAG: hypothetical protein ABIJ96_12950 [Elusimicrobiota bacterium]
MNDLITCMVLPLLAAAPARAGDSDAEIARKFWTAGVEYVLAGDKHQAHVVWTKCAEYDAKNKSCLAGLQLLGARFKLEKKDRPTEIDAELPDVRHVISSGEVQARGKWSEGMIHFQKYDYDAAQTAWRECAELDPKNEDCRLGVKRIDGIRRDVKEKDKWRRKKKPSVAKGKKQEAEKHWNQGILYFQGGEFEKARQEWLRCLARDPSSDDCRQGIERIKK